MTTLAPSMPSQPPSQASSPASPTANFTSQQATRSSSAAHAQFRNGSRPGTPNNGINLNNLPSLDLPPPGMGYAEFVRSWTDIHVTRWLQDCKCINQAATFRANDIRGDVILDLDQATLKEMGIVSIGDRIRILNAVKALRQRCAPPKQHMPHSSSSSFGSSYGTSHGRNYSYEHASPKLTLNGGDHVDFSRTNGEQPNGSDTQVSSRHRARPAPLQLRPAQQADLPRLIHDPPAPPDSARSMRTLPSGASSQGSASNAFVSPAMAQRPNLPPLPPPPRSQPPLPPTSATTPSGARQPARIQNLSAQQNGRRTPTQNDSPHYTLQPPSHPGAGQALLTPSSGASSGSGLSSGSGSGSQGGWKGEYGLPSGPRVVGQTPNRATSPLPPGGGGVGRSPQAPSRTSPNAQHGKSPSFSGAPLRPVGGQTGTSAAGGAAAVGNAALSHPYATSTAATATLPVPISGGAHNLSPIEEGYASPIGAGSGTPPTSGSGSMSSGMYGHGHSYSQGATQAYHVGRGPFGSGNRPTTPTPAHGQSQSQPHIRSGLQHAPAGSQYPQSQSQSHSAGPSLDDLKRNLFKFYLAGPEGRMVTVSIAECQDGVEILEKVLRKFGKLGSEGRFEADESVDGDDGLSIDGWGVFLAGAGEEGPGKALRESEILSICHAELGHPARENGLTINRTGRPKRSKALQNIFGEQPTQPSSPRSPLFNRDGSNRDDDSDSKSALSAEREREIKNMKRASSISVLSGLGVRDPERVLGASTKENQNQGATPGASGGAKSPSATSFAGKMRAFLGQRPPSELIATHLPAYFPNTQPKLLRKTVRKSARYSGLHGLIGRRDSAISVAGNSNIAQTQTQNLVGASASVRSRFSSSSRASLASLPPPPPPVPEKSDDTRPPRVSLSTSDGQSVDLDPNEDASTSTGASRPQSRQRSKHLLPPVNFSSESFAESFHGATANGTVGARAGGSPAVSRTASTASWRTSYISELRSRRDRSDTASMLTVDEITAEVENKNRRKSMAASMRSVDTESLNDAGATASINVEDVDEEDETLEGGEEEEYEEEEYYDEEEEEGEDEEDEEEEEEEDVEGTTLNEADEDDAPVVGTVGKRGMKWIRGALIGAGSFGSVYLGMDAMNGLLMAVKQVELPTGSGPNEERKKSMLNALEREIDLLKDLQHENIVQYLDSSTDDTHLNIFLEYVPGGSVTALLRNYGAFEEALCRHFVRQILQGLSYLHEQDIIHRDIKGANILVDNKGGIKISDFGISKKVEDTLLSAARVHRPSLQGSVYWMAPEVVKQTAYTYKADIWSVGCLVVEMLTGTHPWAQLNQMQAIFKIGSMAKPAIPSDISPEAEDFLLRTFEINHEARPSAADLLQHAWIVKGPSSVPTKSSSAKPKGGKGA